MHPAALGMPLHAEQRRRDQQVDRRRCACPHRGTVLGMTVLGRTMLGQLGLFLPLLSRTSQPLPVLQRSTRVPVQVPVPVPVQVPVPVRVRVPARVPARVQVQVRVPVPAREHPRGRDIYRSPQHPR